MPDKKFSLVADVGGTNVRFALVESGSTLLQSQCTYLCVDHDSLVDAATHYLKQTGLSMGDVRSASLALACPVNADSIQFTNNHWSFRKSELAKALRLKTVLFLNDFTAMALGMIACNPQQMIEVVAGHCELSSPRVVVGPGTGLGFSALIPQGEHWTALATEGGHVGFVPRDATDVQIMQILMSKHNNRVSAERVLCGQGLFNLYQCLAQLAGSPISLNSPSEVSEQGISGADPIATEAVSRFFAHLGAYCGDMVLAYGARGGVYLCGGILPRMVSALQTSQFAKHFLNKGRFSEFMANVPVHLCVAEQPGLKGAALALTGQHACLS